jgi:hypothetical protein
MSAPGFVPGGYEWRATPSPDALRWGRAREVWQWLVWRARNRFFVLELTDAKIAEALGRSRRYVQLALAELQAKGWIAREFVFKVSRWGNTVYRRVIKLLLMPAGSERKSKNTIDLDPKKLDPHRANSCDMISHGVALSSSSEELKAQEQQRPVAGECVQAHPSTGQGEEDAPAEAASLAESPAEVEAKTAAAADGLLAWVQESASQKPASRPQDDSPAARVTVDPSLAAAAKLALLAPAMAAGDSLAIAEAEDVRRRLAALKSEPPEVGQAMATESPPDAPDEERAAT